jgi:hypothetical protein
VRRTLGLLATAALTLALLPVTAAGAAPPLQSRTACEGRDRIAVPGAELQRVSPCMADLTTAGLLAGGFDGVYTDAADWAGLHAPGTVNPRGVEGVQVDGYFADTSTTNPLHGWNHDAQFVIRLPERWNGRLVVAGAPGVRKQYSSDFMVSDRVLAQGYAYASIDKGNTGAFFFRDGERPGDAMREWHMRTTQVARAAQAVVRQAYGKPARHTYMTGVSNGGYLTRWQLENEPGVFDGGVESEGTLFETDNTLLGFLPTRCGVPGVPRLDGRAEGGGAPGDVRRRLRAWLRAAVGPALPRLLGPHAADLPRGARPDVRRRARGGHHPDLPARCARLRVDTVVRRLLAPGRRRRPARSDPHRQAQAADAQPARRPRHAAADRPARHALRELVAEQRRSRLHRAYVVERGQHVDSFVALFPEGALRAMLPCYTDAFDALVAWVERGVQPPASGPVERVAGAAVNDCTL